MKWLEVEVDEFIVKFLIHPIQVVQHQSIGQLPDNPDKG
jgi:hypothetical protein